MFKLIRKIILAWKLIFGLIYEIDYDTKKFKRIKRQIRKNYLKSIIHTHEWDEIVEQMTICDPIFEKRAKLILQMEQSNV